MLPAYRVRLRLYAIAPGEALSAGHGADAGAGGEEEAKEERPDKRLVLRVRLRALHQQFVRASFDPIGVADGRWRCVLWVLVEPLAEPAASRGEKDLMSLLLALRGVGAGQVAAMERAAAQFRRLRWSVQALAPIVFVKSTPPGHPPGACA